MNYFGSSRGIQLLRFVLCLIFQGMYYLHTSPIQTHGRLTSSRCVIDSRFVLKITGFGLDTINSLTNKQQTTESAYSILFKYLYLSVL
jgi:hypothetical protein